MRFVAIDPGTRHTGLAYMDDSHVIETKTFNFKESVGSDNSLLINRCVEIWKLLELYLEEHEHQAIVMEGFVPFPGAKNCSHQTPLLVGFLAGRILVNHQKLIIQTSSKVLNPRTRGNMAFAKSDMAEGREVFPGCLLARNDHERSAIAHGMYFLANNKETPND